MKTATILGLFLTIAVLVATGMNGHLWAYLGWTLAIGVVIGTFSALFVAFSKTPVEESKLFVVFTSASILAEGLVLGYLIGLPALFVIAARFILSDMVRRAFFEGDDELVAALRALR